MKLGIVGSGKIVEELLPHIGSIGFEEIFLLTTERSAEKGKKMCVDYGLSGTTTDYDVLLSKCDTVYVAAPNNLHFSFTRRALDEGKNVICEKPIAVSSYELEKLSELAMEKGVMLFEAMSIHHMPSFISMKRDLKKLGDIKLVNFNFSQYSSRYSLFREGEIHPVFDPQRSGGTLMDLNIYNIHAIVALFGMPDSVEYFANMERGVDTSGVLVCSYGSFTAVLISAKDCSAPNLCLIQGTEGTLCAEDTINYMTGYTITYNDRRPTEHYAMDAVEYRLVYEMRAFKAAIESGDRSLCDTLMGISKGAAKILDDARRQVGMPVLSSGI